MIDSEPQHSTTSRKRTHPAETSRLPEHARRCHRRTAAAAAAADRRRRTSPAVAVVVTPITTVAAAAFEAGVSSPALPMADGEEAAGGSPGAFPEVLEKMPVGDEGTGRVSGIVGGGVSDARVGVGVGWGGSG